MTRTERESEQREIADFSVLPPPENLRNSRTSEPLLPKGNITEPSFQITRLRDVSQGERKPHLREKEKRQSGAWRGKSQHHSEEQRIESKEIKKWTKEKASKDNFPR